MVTTVLDPDGELARAKVFHRRDVVVAVGPQLFGRPQGELRRTVDAVMRTREVVPLLPTDGARERVWALASVLTTETAIAETVARGAATQERRRPAGGRGRRARHRRNAEARLGHRLTEGQRRMVTGICRSGERVSLVLGVAGAGKTTALRCVADAYRAAGYEVIGTATSGQAARTLGTEAGIDASRTIASLRWQLDHGRLELGPRHVVILDEAGMTDDPDLLRLLVACEVAGAKVVLVGDDRQLGAVGPGGGLGALLERHGGQAHVLDENVRQHDPAERTRPGRAAGRRSSRAPSTTTPRPAACTCLRIGTAVVPDGGRLGHRRPRRQGRRHVRLAAAQRRRPQRPGSRTVAGRRSSVGTRTRRARRTPLPGRRLDRHPVSRTRHRDQRTGRRGSGMIWPHSEGNLTRWRSRPSPRAR